MTEHTTMPKMSRSEVIQTVARRRRSLEEKRRIVAGAESGFRQTSATARRYGGPLGAAEPASSAQAVGSYEACSAALCAPLVGSRSTSCWRTEFASSST
jgi:hypothetical protein